MVSLHIMIPVKAMRLKVTRTTIISHTYLEGGQRTEGTREQRDAGEVQAHSDDGHGNAAKRCGLSVLTVQRIKISCDQIDKCSDAADQKKGER
jgi:hypothetical protein